MIKYLPLSDQVYELIQKKIVNREISPGERLIEEKIGQEIGVSRTTVKRALTRLLEEGFLEYRDRKGVYVKLCSEKEFLEIYDVREVLEGLSARLASQLIDKNAIAEFKQIEKCMERNVQENDHDSYIEADLKFHTLLVNSSQSQLLSRIMSTFRLRILTFDVGLIRDPKETIHEHREIVRALEDRNAEKAEQLLREHIHRSRQKLIKNSIE